MMRRSASLAFLAVLAACSGESDDVGARDPGTPSSDQRYAVTATVLESPSHGPQLCLGGVATSLPPQCGGPDVVGWDWDGVEGKESVNGTTWGAYSLVGTWDGERFTLTQTPGPPQRTAPSFDGAMDFATPCDAPAGGWTVQDPATATDPALEAATAYARRQTGYAGLWVDQSINPGFGQERPDEAAMNDPARLVLNVRFTDELARHERELRTLWGGPLCVSPAEHTVEELRKIQRNLHEELDALTSSVDEVHGTVEVTVILAEEGLEESLDERYGPGVVEVSSRLRPVGGN